MNTYDESIKAADAYTRRVEMRLPEINAQVAADFAAWTEHYLFTPVAKDISKPCRNRWGWCFTHMAKALPEGYTPPPVHGGQPGLRGLG